MGYIEVMKDLVAIEEQIKNLPPELLVQFREWFHDFEASLWDAQIERDSKSGRLNDLVAEARREYETGKTRDWKIYITADPNVMHGAVCLKGTRIPVTVVLDNLAAGLTAKAILEEYSTLKPEHVAAAMAYAADLARERVVSAPVG